MDKEDVLSLVRCFSDKPQNVIIEKGVLTAEVRDEIYEVSIEQTLDGIFCKEGDVVYPIRRWIVERLAKLPLLARRIVEYEEDDELLIDAHAQVTHSLSEDYEEEDKLSSNVLSEFPELINRLPNFMTQVVYLTSDAGEGKTSILTALAIEQAKKYINRESDWLLLPVRLGGRSFIRLDDVVVGALTNRLRFPFLYYDSVIELVKMGSLVLALDGFEEMFIETQSGEAVSSMGSLVKKLESSGKLVVAARTAYYEYRNFKTQSKLFKSLGDSEVAFSKVELKRWDKKQFLYLSKKIGLSTDESESLYQNSEKRLGQDHPLLTRAVLARRFIEEYANAEDRDTLLFKLTASDGEDYFDNFVRTLLEREVNEKWIDRSGDEPSQALLTVDQHKVILMAIAEEMWRSKVEALRPDVVELTTELAVSDSLGLSASVADQAIKRISQHAILKTVSPSKLLAFDHEEFRFYFLGRRLGECLLMGMGMDEVRRLLRIGALPVMSVKTAVSHIKQHGAVIKDIVYVLSDLSKKSSRSSYERLNAGQICLEILDGGANESIIEISGLDFKVGSLEAVKLSNVRFEDCIFQRTSLDKSVFCNVSFSNCDIVAIEVVFSESMVVPLGFDRRSLPSELDCIYSEEREEKYFSPESVTQVLLKFGASVEACGDAGSDVILGDHGDQDRRIQLTERLMRYFQRSTALNDALLKMKFGQDWPDFEAQVLPKIIEVGLIREVVHKGAGKKRRFALALGFDDVEKAREKSNGDFEKFIESLNG